MKPEIYGLLHLADSALPMGGFAFSNGLEAAAKTGLFSDHAGFRNYLSAYLEQLGDLELPFINSCYEAEAPSRAVEEWNALMLIPAIHRASTIQGRGWLRLLADLHPDTPIEDVRDFFRRDKRPVHFLPAFSMSMKQLQHSLSTCRQLFLYIMLRDQISAAIRLGLLGPSGGHALQAYLYPRCSEVEQAAAGKDYRDAARNCPALELVQGHHDRLYTRLFQN